MAESEQESVTVRSRTVIGTPNDLRTLLLTHCPFEKLVQKYDVNIFINVSW